MTAGHPSGGAASPGGSTSQIRSQFFVTTVRVGSLDILINDAAIGIIVNTAAMTAKRSRSPSRWAPVACRRGARDSAGSAAPCSIGGDSPSLTSTIRTSKLGGMARARLTPLACALLGLLQESALSGYALRKVFASTPMGHYSDSPGSIYPALRRLERMGLVAGHADGEGRGPRRRVFHPTTAGLNALRLWLRHPLAPDDIVWRIDELTLRFAFMERILGRRETIRFLRAYRVLVGAHVAELERYRDAHSRGVPLSPRLALQAGINLYRTRAEWADAAVKQYRGDGGRPAGRRAPHERRHA